MDCSGDDAGDQGSLSIWHSDIGTPIHFQEESGLVTFEAFNSTSLSRCQSVVIPPVQMRQSPTAFSRISTGDSDIPSSCDMKQEPKFKILQGKLAFFESGLSRYFPLETESTESLSPTYC